MNLKGTKITDPVILERLRLAREKALTVRQANAKDKKDAKLVTDIEAKKEKEVVQSKLAKLTAVDETVEEEEPVKKAVKKAVKKKPVIAVESESEEEEEPVVVKKPKAKPKKKKIVYVEEEDSSSEEEVVVKRKKKIPTPPPTTPVQEQPVAMQQPDPVGDLYRKIYG